MDSHRWRHHGYLSWWYMAAGVPTWLERRIGFAKVRRAVLRERNSTPLNYYHTPAPPVISLLCYVYVLYTQVCAGKAGERGLSEIVCRLILIQFSVQMSATGRAKAAALFQPDDLWRSLVVDVCGRDVLLLQIGKPNGRKSWATAYTWQRLSRPRK